MLDLTVSVLSLNKLVLGHYAEPYAGGCGLALALLYGGHVSDIHINDIDPSVWAFWHCVLHDSDALIELVKHTPITLDEWHRQREIHRAQNKRDRLRLGFSAFFLNRTNRSGIIKGAGVIGGLSQGGNYKIDCRFNRDELSRRIARVAKYKDRIHLSNLDARAFLTRSDKVLPPESLFFIDPPYFKKGSRLYTSFYRPEDHAELAETVLASDRKWIITYDDMPEIRRLYRGRRQYCFDIHYSLHEKRIGTELLIASKGLRMPDDARQRQVNLPNTRAA